MTIAAAVAVARIAAGERRSGKLTVNQGALTGGEGGRQRSLAAMKRKQVSAPRQKGRNGRH